MFAGSRKYFADVLHFVDCGDQMFVGKVEERLCVLQPWIQVKVQVRRGRGHFDFTGGTGGFPSLA